MNIEGYLVLVASMVLFFGSTHMLLSAIFGVRMGYLVAATGFFGFWVLLAALWAFGAPGTPRYLGPKGDLPTWVAVAAGTDLRSQTYPVIDQYPEGEWRTAEEAGLSGEIEPATLAFQEFLSEQANAELASEGLEGQVPPESFSIDDLRFATVDETPLAAATGASSTGGRKVEVVGYLDPGDEGFPSWLALGIGLVGFAVHVPFLDRAERKRKEVLTGGDQAPWRGPA